MLVLVLESLRFVQATRLEWFSSTGTYMGLTKWCVMILLANSCNDVHLTCLQQLYYAYLYKSAGIDSIGLGDSLSPYSLRKIAFSVCRTSDSIICICCREDARLRSEEISVGLTSLSAYKSTFIMTPNNTLFFPLYGHYVNRTRFTKFSSDIRTPQLNRIISYEFYFFTLLTIHKRQYFLELGPRWLTSSDARRLSARMHIKGDTTNTCCFSKAS